MKGVSPVVATVLMVAVAIAAAVVAYSWFMSMQASVQAEASRGAGTVGKERFVVEAVSCHDNNELDIYVRNIGEEKISGSFTVTVKDASTGLVLKTGSVSFSVLPGETNTIKNFSVDKLSNCRVTGTNSDYVIVEVTAPGGSVASKQERIASNNG